MILKLAELEKVLVTDRHQPMSGIYNAYLSGKNSYQSEFSRGVEL